MWTATRTVLFLLPSCTLASGQVIILLSVCIRHCWGMSLWHYWGMSLWHCWAMSLCSGAQCARSRQWTRASSARRSRCTSSRSSKSPTAPSSTSGGHAVACCYTAATVVILMSFRMFSVISALSERVVDLDKITKGQVFHLLWFDLLFLTNFERISFQLRMAFLLTVRAHQQIRSCCASSQDGEMQGAFLCKMKS